MRSYLTPSTKSVNKILYQKILNGKFAKVNKNKSSDATE